MSTLKPSASRISRTAAAVSGSARPCALTLGSAHSRRSISKECGRSSRMAFRYRSIDVAMSGMPGILQDLPPGGIERRELGPGSRRPGIFLGHERPDHGVLGRAAFAPEAAAQRGLVREAELPGD